MIQFYTYVCPSFLRFFSHIVFLFNWSVVALQCCVSFCCKAKRISCTYSCVPSFFGLASHLGRCGALGNIPCALRRVRVSYQFMHSGVGGEGFPGGPGVECVCVSPSLSSHHPPTPALGSIRLSSVSESLFLAQEAEGSLAAETWMEARWVRF